jgi:adenine C2-methylase RlmN of 23S rRNA A2503 and tRNA A37
MYPAAAASPIAGLSDLTTWPKEQRASMAASLGWHAGEVVTRHTSADGTRKLLVATPTDAASHVGA